MRRTSPDDQKILSRNRWLAVAQTEQARDVLVDGNAALAWSLDFRQGLPAQRLQDQIGRPRTGFVKVLIDSQHRAGPGEALRKADQRQAIAQGSQHQRLYRGRIV